MKSLSLLVSPVVYQIGIQVPIEFLLNLAVVGLILLATWIISRVLGSFLSKALGKLSPAIARQARQIVSALTWLIGILIGLAQLGLEITILIVIVTLGGIILVVALRDALSNVASFEVITSYRQFKIGDWIQVGKYFGRVVDITWMDTVLMTPDNERVYIPNSKITQSIVTNRTTPGGTRISVSLLVDKESDLSAVETALVEIGEELCEELVADSNPEVRVISLNTQAIKVALLLKINNPAKGKLIASEVRKKAKKRLDEIQTKISSRDA